MGSQFHVPIALHLTIHDMNSVLEQWILMCNHCKKSWDETLPFQCIDVIDCTVQCAMLLYTTTPVQ